MDEDQLFDELLAEPNPKPLIECTVFNDQLFCDYEKLYVNSHSDASHLGFTITCHSQELRPIAISAARKGDYVSTWHSLKPIYNTCNKYNILGMDATSRKSFDIPPSFNRSEIILYVMVLNQMNVFNLEYQIYTIIFVNSKLTGKSLIGKIKLEKFLTLPMILKEKIEVPMYNNNMTVKSAASDVSCQEESSPEVDFGDLLEFD